MVAFIRIGQTDWTGNSGNTTFWHPRASVLGTYCDLGLLIKPNPDRESDTDAFLAERLFATFAAVRGLDVQDATDDEATEELVTASDDLKSSLGYSPITDVGLLAGSSKPRPP
jgi:hypothetical protein